jgi:hypothetical protein
MVDDGRYLTLVLGTVGSSGDTVDGEEQKVDPRAQSTM